LIQNAEDNRYSDRKVPWLRFYLKQDRIEIDSNEDGFSEENIKAICSIGESTKKSRQGYVGEKGIGFKSVFKVAQRVHVQSEPFSFAFEYRREDRDDGLGMITPLSVKHLDLPQRVQTRIVLHLLDDCDREALREELVNLPDTLLLFLRKLRTLDVRVKLSGQPAVNYHYRLDKEIDDRVSITKQVVIEGSPKTTSTRFYWITKQVVHNMPKDEARDDISKAEVILAFPLDENNAPIVEEQHVYAFLPLRKAGYKVQPLNLFTACMPANAA